MNIVDLEQVLLRLNLDRTHESYWLTTTPDDDEDSLDRR